MNWTIRFLFETMLPALKRLKGRRQIIVATHNANIVVNGDADQVIQLEATADRGHVSHAQGQLKNRLSGMPSSRRSMEGMRHFVCVG